ncbi:sulfotransferase domain-containing protein [Schleiferiaceae bacterium]|jgi:hypothetical protein|nr:sulfotransferase domain-containing protein [Schleiferiaceae bacterium]
MKLHSKYELAKYYLKRLLRAKRKKRIPIYIFGHHKCGTKLFGKIFLKMAVEYGWSYSNVSRKDEIVPNSEVVFFLNAKINPEQLPKKYIGIHLIRDPRDVLVSGYLYHKRTNEAWCTNKKNDISKKISYPQVPYSQMHRSEIWKANYLKSLKGKSYQETLNSLNQYEGLLFELQHYCAWTLEDIEDSIVDTDMVLEVKFEEVMKDYDNSMKKVFNHCNFTKEEFEFAIVQSKKENLKNMSEKELKANTHISSKQTSKWKDYLDQDLIRVFNVKYESLIKKYDY